MSKLIICAVRDRAIDAFMQPFFVPAIGLAVRSFSDEVNRPESPMFGHSEDYDLYHVGQFDPDRGSLEPIEVRMIAIGKDVKRPVGT